MYKKCNIFSRLLRIPEFDVLSELLNDKYWDNWQLDRQNEHVNLLNDEIDDINDINGITTEDIPIINYLHKNPIRNNIVKNKSSKNSFINSLYFASKSYESTDYKFMLDLNYSDIQKRLSYKIIPPKIPFNLFYREPDNESFTKQWLIEFIKEYNLDSKNIDILMSDGSIKEWIGGCGYFGIKANHYLNELDLNGIRNNKMEIKINDEDYHYGAKSVAFRCSIEHPELHGADLALNNELKYIDDNQKIVIICIDNQSVVKWLGGDFDIDDPLIESKIKQIHEIIDEYQDYILISIYCG